MTIASCMRAASGVAALVLLTSFTPRPSAWPSAGPAVAHRAVEFDVSLPLASLGQPRQVLAPPQREEQRPAGPPPVITVPAGSAAVEQVAQGERPAAKIVASFDGMGVGFEGPQGSARLFNPSDNSLAVGPDHIFQIVNSRMAIFTKKGKRFDTTGKCLYGPMPTNTLFTGFAGLGAVFNSGDAVVRYDQLADRWLVILPIFRRGPERQDQPPAPQPGVPTASVPSVAGQPGGPSEVLERWNVGPASPTSRSPQPPGGKGPYAICYAVSVGPNPLGAYYRYEYLRPLFPDYPRVGLWPDGYYVGTSTGDDVIQKHACVVDRAKMLRGEPATEQCVVVDGVNFLNPVDLDGKRLPPAGAPNIVLAGGGTQLKNVFEDNAIFAWQFHVDWSDPSKTRLTRSNLVHVAPYHYLCDGQLTNCVPQPGTERRLDAQGDKLMSRVVYRRLGNTERIVAVHSVNTSAGAGGVRWYELRVNRDRSLAVHQQGTYVPEGPPSPNNGAEKVFRWMASAAIDADGNIGIGYSAGGAALYPGQRFAGRLAADPPGKLTLREAVLVEGEASQNAMRWEDYTQTAIDPSDDRTIWYVGDYLKKDQRAYSTRIAALLLGR